MHTLDLGSGLLSLPLLWLNYLLFKFASFELVLTSPLFPVYLD